MSFIMHENRNMNIKRCIDEISKTIEVRSLRSSKLIGLNALDHRIVDQ